MSPTVDARMPPTAGHSVTWPGTDLARFELFARAVAGRPLAVMRTPGSDAYTDGQAIYLPDGPVSVATLTVQASLVSSGSLDRKVIARLSRRREARARYLTLEAARAVARLSFVVPGDVVRVVREVYPGPLTACAAESLTIAMTGRSDIPAAPSWMGTIRPRGIAAAGEPTGVAPTEADLEEGSPRRSLVRELDEADEEPSERSRILELLSAPRSFQNPLSRLLQSALGGATDPAPGGGGEGQDLPVAGERRAWVGPKGRRMKVPVGLRDALAPRPARGVTYPEWDWRRRRYRPDWCTVSELDLPQEGDPLPRQMDLTLQHALAKLGVSHERHRGEPEGDDLDLDAVVDLVAKQAAGGATTAAVYEARRRTGRDLGVLLLLDASGSTGESDEGHQVFDAQRALVARLTAALDDLGMRVATFAFQSQGRENVRFLRVKDFDDRYDRAARRRLAALEPGGFTRLGAAIRHATDVLTRQAGTGNLLLMVVGDGLPYEEGYEHEYAQEDSRRALSEAVARGVGCACVSMRSSTAAEVVERVWGHVSHRRLERAEDLARHVGPLYREALRAAAASRKQPFRPPDAQDPLPTTERRIR